MSARVRSSLPIEAGEGVAPVPPSGALTDAPLAATIRRVALPAVASSLLMTLFASVDTYWIGTRVGPEGLAAVSTALFWVWLVVSIAEMISVGLTAVAARRHGEGRPQAAAHAVGSTLVGGLLLGALVAALGLHFLDALFALMRTPPPVTALGRQYLATYLLGAPVVFGFFAVDAAFRASGDTRTPFVLLAVSVAITLALDPALILGWGPFPALGIAGAAVATLLTRGGAFVLGVAILRRRGMLHFGRLDRDVLLRVARVGLPTAVTGVAFSLIYVALTRTTTRFGTPALAALGIGHRVESWLFMVGVGFAAATAAIVGQNIGAGRIERAARAGWLATAYCSAIGVVVAILTFSMPERFAALFTADPAVIAEGARYLRIAAVAQLAICAELVLEGALGGAGDTVPPMVASTALTVLRIPVAAWAASQWGTTGIWWTITLTAAGRGIAMVLLWRSGRWRRKTV